MKIKFSGSMLLYVIIIALIVYLLFLRQQNTSGYNKNSNENRLYYKKGVDDFNSGKSMSSISSLGKMVTEKDPRDKYKRKRTFFKPRDDKVEAYRKGYSDAKDLFRYKAALDNPKLRGKLRNHQSSGFWQGKVNRMTKEILSNMPVGVSTTSSLPFLGGTTLSLPFLGGTTTTSSLPFLGGTSSFPFLEGTSSSSDDYLF